MLFEFEPKTPMSSAECSGQPDNVGLEGGNACEK